MIDAALRTAYLRYFPADAARCVEDLPNRVARRDLRGLDTDALICCLDHLSRSRATQVFCMLDDEQQRDVLREAPPRLAIALLIDIKKDERDALLASLPAAVREDLERLQHYDEDSAGRLLDRPYDTIRSDMTVADALEVLRRSGTRRARTVYVVDRENRLVGRVDMQTMAMATRDQQLEELLEPVEATLFATAPRSEVVELLER
ncbi:MAG: CBS domain-containing protein, partial [Woeseiaceae bacterium]|nr:CBS domain-containing protein [Woeseiaceae bacterium]